MINIFQGNCGNEPTAITNIPTTTLPVSEPEPDPEPTTTPGPVVTPITEEGETPSTGVTPVVTPGVSIPYSVETTTSPVVTPTAPGEPTTGIKTLYLSSFKILLLSFLASFYKLSLLSHNNLKLNTSLLQSSKAKC